MQLLLLAAKEHKSICLRHTHRQCISNPSGCAVPHFKISLHARTVQLMPQLLQLIGSDDLTALHCHIVIYWLTWTEGTAGICRDFLTTRLLFRSSILVYTQYCLLRCNALFLVLTNRLLDGNLFCSVEALLLYQW